MASADLRDELSCSICLAVYSDPVTLRCGHNFCWVCIDRVLHTQEASGGYSCPECRDEFQVRPALQRNTTLRNIAERFMSDGPGDNVISCTYCDSPTPAAKTCVLCEASLCDKHLNRHSKSPEHVLIDPTTSLENRKCSVHKELLKFYCAEESTCVCVTCCLAGKHKGHEVEPLDEASEKKKETMRNILMDVASIREKTEEGIRKLQERLSDIEVKAAGETERVAAMFSDLRRQLDNLEKKLLMEISQKQKQVSCSIDDLIAQLEIKKDELTRKMSHMEDLCNVVDPLTVLQESCHIEGADEVDTKMDRKFRDVGDLDEGLITATIHKGVSEIMNSIKEDLLLDENTAAYTVLLSANLKCATYSGTSQNRPETPNRFNYHQVLSTKGFSSGKHYWEVETSQYGECVAGMAYPTTPRQGCDYSFGDNDKSWCLNYNGSLKAKHDRKVIPLSLKPRQKRFGVYLDYESGRLSFYYLGDPIRRLHTFTTTFTEPLHAAIRVWMFPFENKGEYCWVQIR